MSWRRILLVAVIIILIGAAAFLIFRPAEQEGQEATVATPADVDLAGGDFDLAPQIKPGV